MKSLPLGDPAWLGALQKGVAKLPFGKSEHIYLRLLEHLNGRSDAELSQAAYFLVTYLDSHENTYAGSSDSGEAKLNATNVACHFDDSPPASPLANANVTQYLAIGGLIKLFQATVQVGDKAKVVSASISSLISAAELLVDAAQFDDWATFVEEIKLGATANGKLQTENEGLQVELAELKEEIDKKVRAKAKRKVKKAKSAAAKAGHADHIAKKKKAIDLYIAGTFSSVVQAAKEIAPKVFMTRKTVRNWIYGYNKAKKATAQ